MPGGSRCAVYFSVRVQRNNYPELSTAIQLSLKDAAGFNVIDVMLEEIDDYELTNARPLPGANNRQRKHQHAWN
jgi:hypothetical protein